MGKIEEHYTKINEEIDTKIAELGSKANSLEAVLQFHSSSDKISEVITPNTETTEENHIEEGKVICTFPITKFSSLFSSLDIKGLVDVYKDMECRKGKTDEAAILCIYIQEKENARDYKLEVQYYLPYKDMLLVEQDDVKKL